MSSPHTLLKALRSGQRLENWGRCAICKQHDYLSIHTCPPAWHVRHAEYDEDDHDVIFASSAEGAAIAFVDDGDYDGGTYEIAVRPVASDEPWKIFNVRGETTIQFYAEDITPEPEQAPEPEEEE